MDFSDFLICIVCLGGMFFVGRMIFQFIGDLEKMTPEEIGSVVDFVAELTKNEKAVHFIRFHNPEASLQYDSTKESYINSQKSMAELQLMQAEAAIKQAEAERLRAENKLLLVELEERREESVDRHNDDSE